LENKKVKSKYLDIYKIKGEAKKRKRHWETASKILKNPLN